MSQEQGTEQRDQSETQRFAEELRMMDRAEAIAAIAKSRGFWHQSDTNPEETYGLLVDAIRSAETIDEATAKLKESFPEQPDEPEHKGFWSGLGKKKS